MGEATTTTTPSPPISDHSQTPKLILTPSEASSLATSLGFPSVADSLPTLVNLGRRHARAPISSFPVCAAALASDGSLFLGVNLEFPNLPLHHSVHAEQFLLTSLSLHHPNPNPDLLTIVVSAFPCGHCRQFLQEIRSAPNINVLVSPDFDSQPLSFLLPNRFGPDDLLSDDIPLLLEPHNNSLSLSPEISDRLAVSALEAANGSHAPYSECPSGVAVMDTDGRIFKGSYMESAAYNPSMQPAQAAIVAFIAAAEVGGGGYERIAAAALVEKDGAVVRQEETVRLFFQSVIPNCRFNVFHCKSESKRISN